MSEEHRSDLQTREQMLYGLERDRMERLKHCDWEEATLGDDDGCKRCGGKLTRGRRPDECNMP